MATCQEVIRSAYRRSGVVAAGTTLSALQLNIGLERLIGMYLEWIVDGAFGKLCDYYLTTGNYTAVPWQRIYKADPASVITIPATVPSSDTGKISQPPDGCLIEVTNPNAAPPVLHDYLYDVWAGWTDLQGLTKISAAPLSAKYFETVANNLALRLCDEFGMQPPPQLGKFAGLGMLSMVTRYDSARREWWSYTAVVNDFGFVYNARGDGRYM